ncbi:MAG TPA: hypothetical protein VFM09_07050 [Marmoricola sp.]|nr:hypothetical protein [Marmoricola sp.]
MVFAVAVLVVVALVLPVVLVMTLRRWELDEAKVESRLRAPGAHKVTYVVPTGQDPAVLRAALSGAGFTSVVDEEAGAEWLVVGCEAQERARVREVLEHVEHTRFEGTMRAEQVRFAEDA